MSKVEEPTEIENTCPNKAKELLDLPVKATGDEISKTWYLMPFILIEIFEAKL